MKLWQVVIGLLILITLPVTGACLVDKPYYSSDEVVTIVKQWQESFVGGAPIQCDRYGAKLVGTPLVTNFKLDAGMLNTSVMASGKYLLWQAIMRVLTNKRAKNALGTSMKSPAR
jgi:hypothetical protein